MRQDNVVLKLMVSFDKEVRLIFESHIEDMIIIESIVSEEWIDDVLRRYGL